MLRASLTSFVRSASKYIDLEERLHVAIKALIQKNNSLQLGHHYHVAGQQAKYIDFKNGEHKFLVNGHPHSYDQQGNLRPTNMAELYD